jgi:hypothetical protein
MGQDPSLAARPDPEATREPARAREETFLEWTLSSPYFLGGMLAALLLWRRLLREGPTPLGRTTYWGTAPAWTPAGADGFAQPEPAGLPELVDVLDTAVAAVEARFTIAADGSVVGIDLWPAPDADPCEIRLLPPPAGSPLPPGVPGTIEVRHGDDLFGTFQIEELRVEPAAGGDDARTNSGPEETS